MTLAKLLLWSVSLLAIAFVFACLCSYVGQISVPFALWTADAETWTIWQIRMYRLGVAAIVGAGLAVSGVALQALLRNPLAEPYILGVSSGAGVGVLLGSSIAVGMLLPGWAVTPVLSGVGAMLTMVGVYVLAQRRGKLDPLVLLLSGVIINVFNGALIVAIMQFIKQEEAIEYIWWSFGKIPQWLWFRPALLVVAGVLTLASWGFILTRGAAFNAMGLGDEVAASMGVSVERLRVETFIVVSVMTAAAVALAGPIGFVGLIVPHVCRLIWGPDHRLLLVVSGFCGAIFLMAADTLARMIGDWLHLGELPVGVITAICGGPFFLMLLRRKLGGAR